MDQRAASARQQQKKTVWTEPRPATTAATAHGTKQGLPGSRQAAGLAIPPRNDTAPWARAGQTSSAPFSGHGVFRKFET